MAIVAQARAVNKKASSKTLLPQGDQARINGKEAVKQSGVSKSTSRPSSQGKTKEADW